MVGRKMLGTKYHEQLGTDHPVGASQTSVSHGKHQEKNKQGTGDLVHQLGALDAIPEGPV